MFTTQSTAPLQTSYDSLEYLAEILTSKLIREVVELGRKKPFAS